MVDPSLTLPHTPPPPVRSCVYIAPHEALAKDVAEAWGAKFGEGLGVEVTALTGDTAADLKLLERGNVVVATPVQWDMISRRCGRLVWHGADQLRCLLTSCPYLLGSSLHDL